MFGANVHHRTCHLCEAMCGVTVRHEAEVIVDLRGDPEDPLSRGHVCPKVVGLKDVHEDPDRLRLPQRRIGSRWETISWKEAFDTVASRITQVQDAHGKNAVAIYQGNPTVHNIGALLHGQVFNRSIRTRNRFSATSLDQLPHMLSSLTMFGHQLLFPIPDVDRTNFLLIFGANPVVSNGSLLTAPGMDRRIKAIRARGGKVVVVDPRRTETAELADRHLFIRPNTDAHLLLSMLNVILLEHGPALSRLEPMVNGLDQLRALVVDFTPKRVAGPTGIDEAIIRDTALSFARADRAVAYGRVGVSTQAFGGLCSWLINVLNIITGNFDRPGGMMFTKPAVDMVAGAARVGQRGHFAVWKSRVRGLPEFGGELPTAVLAEEIETPGDGQIRALLTSMGNPVLSAPNGRRLERALSQLDFMVSIDIYKNETTRHAHLILPTGFGVENAHYDLAFHLLAVRNTAKYSPPLFPLMDGAKYDWQIYAELASRFPAPRSRIGRLKAKAKRRALLALTPERLLDVLLRTGPHRLSLDRLRKEPHGVDLGPLEPCLPERLYTPDKKIALVPSIYRDDLVRLKATLDPSNRPGGLELIGRRLLGSNNSWMHNVARLMKGRNRCTLLMNPLDAEKRGLMNGATVQIRSRVGQVLAELEISDEIMPGVVSLPHGFGHDREGVELRVARQHAGVSANDLTDEQEIDHLSGNVAFSGVKVEVEIQGAASKT